jgi:hypothetical protein
MNKKEEIKKSIKDILLVYGEQYGQTCYHAGQDKKRKLPKDEFIDLSVDKLYEKLFDDRISKSPNWDEIVLFVEQNPKKQIHGFPFSVPFPKMYGGQEYEIITVSGEKFTARVDDSREFMSEGLEWKTLGKNREGNKEQSDVAAWKLIPKK